MKKISLIVLASCLCVTVAAAEGDKGKFMEKFTPEQQECIKEKSAGCPTFEKTEKTVGEKREKTPEMEAAMECKKQAMTDCGIDVSQFKKEKTAESES